MADPDCGVSATAAPEAVHFSPPAERRSTPLQDALLRHLFESCDTGRSGRITLEQFRPVAQGLAGGELPEEATQGLFKDLGPDESGCVDYERFASNMGALLRARVSDVFDEFDADDDGVLSAAELSDAVQQLLGSPDASEAARALLSQYDTQGVGGINRPTFESIFLRLASRLGLDESISSELSAPSAPSAGPGAAAVLPAASATAQSPRRPLLARRPSLLMSPIGRRRAGECVVLESDDAQDAEELRSRGLSNDEVARYREAFRRLDARRLGVLGAPELRAAFPDSDASTVMAVLDRNWSGAVEFVEFAVAMSELQHTGTVRGVALKPLKGVAAPAAADDHQQAPSSAAAAAAAAAAGPDLEQQERVEQMELAIAQGAETVSGLEKNLHDFEGKNRRLEKSLEREREQNQDLLRELAHLKEQLELERRDALESKKAYRHLEQELLTQQKNPAHVPAVFTSAAAVAASAAPTPAGAAPSAGPGVAAVPAGVSPSAAASAAEAAAEALCGPMPIVMALNHKSTQALMTTARGHPCTPRKPSRERELLREKEELQRQLKSAIGAVAAEKASFHQQEQRYLVELEACRRIIEETRRAQRALEMARQGLLSPKRTPVKPGSERSSASKPSTPVAPLPPLQLEAKPQAAEQAQADASPAAQEHSISLADELTDAESAQDKEKEQELAQANEKLQGDLKTALDKYEAERVAFQAQETRYMAELDELKKAIEDLKRNADMVSIPSTPEFTAIDILDEEGLPLSHAERAGLLGQELRSLSMTPPPGMSSCCARHPSCPTQ
eukprot:m51a1_g6832 hypothetical protein (792) ;mRNA; r:49863-52729